MYRIQVGFFIEAKTKAVAPCIIQSTGPYINMLNWWLQKQWELLICVKPLSPQMNTRKNIL